jgi:hypothetical protein
MDMRKLVAGEVPRKRGESAGRFGTLNQLEHRGELLELGTNYKFHADKAVKVRSPVLPEGYVQ